MDATELLQKDHDKVRELFRQYRGGGGITGLVKRVTGNVSDRQRRSAVDKVCDELDVHAMIEEEVLYPAVKAIGDEELSHQVDEGIREHGTVKEQVAALRRTEGVSPDVDEHMSKLEECVEHHAGEEEREMFPRLREIVPDQARAELGRQLQARKRAGSAASASRSRRAPARRAGKTTAAKARSTRPRAAKASKTGRGRRPVGRARTTTAKKAKAPKRARGGRRR